MVCVVSTMAVKWHDCFSDPFRFVKLEPFFYCTVPHYISLSSTLPLLSFCLSVWPNSKAVPGHLWVHQGRETVLLQSSEVLRGRSCFGGGHDGRFCWDFQRWSGGFPTVSEEVCGESLLYQPTTDQVPSEIWRTDTVTCEKLCCFSVIYIHASDYCPLVYVFTLV